MSAARVEQLKSLLARVQERRAAPRVSAVAVVSAPAPAHSVAEVRVRANTPEPTLQPPTTDARAVAKTVADLRQVSLAPEPLTAAAPPLELDDMQGMEPQSVAPVARKLESERTTARTANDLPATPVSEPELESLPPLPMPAPEAPLMAPSARVEAPLLARSEPVVRVVSSPRIEAPKNFGDLLEASLSLRPR
jgi:hypothetical protein